MKDGIINEFGGLVAFAVAYGILKMLQSYGIKIAFGYQILICIISVIVFTVARYKFKKGQRLKQEAKEDEIKKKMRDEFGE